MNNPYESPGSNSSEAAETAPRDRRRGFFLSAFLVLMMVSNALAAFALSVNGEAITSELPKLSSRLVGLLSVVSGANVVLALLVWNWRKVGVYGFFVSATLAFAVNLYAEVPAASIIGGLIGPLLLSALVAPKWARFA